MQSRIPDKNSSIESFKENVVNESYKEKSKTQLASPPVSVATSVTGDNNESNDLEHDIPSTLEPLNSSNSRNEKHETSIKQNMEYMESGGNRDNLPPELQNDVWG